MTNYTASTYVPLKHVLATWSSTSRIFNYTCSYERSLHADAHIVVSRISYVGVQIFDFLILTQCLCIYLFSVTYLLAQVVYSHVWEGTRMKRSDFNCIVPPTPPWYHYHHVQRNSISFTRYTNCQQNTR